MTHDQASIMCDFDDAAYLAANPGIRKVVEEGGFRSGWHHYVLHGYRNEKRRGVDPAFRQRLLRVMEERDAERYAPPPHLRKRVHGAEDLASFRNSGKTIALDIYLALQSSGIRLGENSSVLDFGCGSGRVVHYLHDFYIRGTFCGTDIDDEAIGWCQRHLRQHGHFTANREMPPLHFRDGLFDMVYSISLFTHLPAPMQDLWLAELCRVTKIGGYLLLTVKSADRSAAAIAGGDKRLEETGFSHGGDLTDGLPEFYRSAWHTREYVQEHWARFFQINRIINRGIANFQDLVMCRRVE